MIDDFRPAKKKPRSKKPFAKRLAEPRFDTREPIEADKRQPKADAVETSIAKTNSGKKKPNRIIASIKAVSKKQWALGIAVILILVGVGANMYVRRPLPPDTTEYQRTVYIPPEPVKTTEPSRLTGVEIKKELNTLPTTSVQIENSPDARPQAGLYDAGIVTEALVEGGITRFNAIYMEKRPKRIGPIRSLRRHYIDFFWPYDAPIVHAGGSGHALAQVRSLKLKDIDHGPNAGLFSRDSQRFAPHNLFSNGSALLKHQQNKGWKTSTFKGLERKEESPAEKPNAKTVKIDISSFLYNSEYRYDAKTNSYLRYMAGKPHVDEIGKQINPKVVVVLVMDHRYEGIYSVYKTTGKGTAYVFQDGTVTKGTWTKPGRDKNYTLKDTKGEIIGLNPGQTWQILADNPKQITFTP